MSQPASNSDEQAMYAPFFGTLVTFSDSKIIQTHKISSN